MWLTCKHMNIAKYSEGSSGCLLYFHLINFRRLLMLKTTILVSILYATTSFFFSPLANASTSYKDIAGQRMALKKQLSILKGKCDQTTDAIQKRNCMLNLRIFYNQEVRRLQRLSADLTTKNFEATQ